MMDDSFRVRVDKVFGSLAPSTPSSLRSLWSLTDEEVERKEWNRERGTIDRGNDPCSSSFDGFFSKQRKTSEEMLQKKLDDDDGYEGEKQDEEVEDWDIRSSIGLDSTLDYEEEEDENDKVALGKEKDAGERLYMKDITDYGPYLNSHNVIPESFDEHAARERDSRANVYAAKIRLKEDEKEAFGSDNKVAVPLIEDGRSSSNSNSSLKSILKRKDNKSQKRVRFDPAAHIPKEEEEEAVMLNNNKSKTGRGGVPDYIQNPSRYTRYSFDSGNEADENTNQQAFMDFLNTIKKPDSEPHDLVPKSVTFIPKKKAMKEGVSSKKTSQAPGIVATSTEDEACAMEEDDPVEAKSGSSQRGGRRYRFKLYPDD